MPDTLAPTPEVGYSVAITLNDRKFFMIKPLLMSQVMRLSTFQMSQNAFECAWKMKTVMHLNTKLKSGLK